MPVLAIFSGSTSQSDYEALRKEVNWEKDLPSGGIFHAASFDDAGNIHVADVWDSAEHMNAFVEKRLMPAFQKLGLTPPDVEVFPVYNLNAYKAISGYML